MSHIVPGRMRELALGLALAVVFAGASGGCTLLLDTDGANPHSCNVDADCAQLPNAVCDNARRVCVPRLPPAGVDGGAPMDGGVDDPRRGWTPDELAEHVRLEFSTYRWLFEPMLERTGFEILAVDYVRRAYGAYTCRR